MIPVEETLVFVYLEIGDFVKTLLCLLADVAIETAIVYLGGAEFGVKKGGTVGGEVDDLD